MSNDTPESMGAADLAALLERALPGVSGSALAKLAEVAEEVVVPAGGTIASEGDPADGAYVVADGSVLLGIHQRHMDLAVATLGPGELLGWSWMVEPNRWSFDVSSPEGARLVRLPAPAVSSLVDSDPEAGLAISQDLLGVVARRLRDTRIQLLDLLGAVPASPGGSSGDASSGAGDTGAAGTGPELRADGGGP